MVIALFLCIPFAITLYLQQDQTVAFMRTLASQAELVVGERTLSVDIATLREMIIPAIPDLAVTIARQLSVLAAKFVVFSFVVFALLYYHDQLRPLAYDLIPPEYHDIEDAVHTRIREVLFGHYVLALVGGVITYIAALAVFSLLGYSLPFVFALFAAILWILPFVSPTVLVFAIGIYHVLQGEFGSALLIAVLGAVFLIAIPRAVVEDVRHRFGNPRPLSSAVYFVGFVGGFLTIGIVGIIVGPLALAVLGVLLDLLSTDSGQTTLS